MLVRSHCAAHRLGAGEGPVETALACGYVDQSHLHRDVHAFTGCTPGALARMEATSARDTADVTVVMDSAELDGAERKTP
ncbi:AraC family transcriptional regulator [Streptomyces aurantiacus]|uniref:HTH araC/xylS-type domain-containing protein n=1 Tax=Streptomyces aurantiacus JA 4570 TaxID=1286094 RepID=S3ZDI1_9ACTN|nr:AraC family transcriptional regulator [Streptomyces aurantiacus]EPH41168.1 hypothetical protein STRAU_5820 [Streptomyces aurantiacus JA 4570]